MRCFVIRIDGVLVLEKVLLDFIEIVPSEERKCSYSYVVVVHSFLVRLEPFENAVKGISGMAISLLVTFYYIGMDLRMKQTRLNAMKTYRPNNFFF